MKWRVRRHHLRESHTEAVPPDCRWWQHHPGGTAVCAVGARPHSQPEGAGTRSDESLRKSRLFGSVRRRTSPPHCGPAPAPASYLEAAAAVCWSGRNGRIAQTIMRSGSTVGRSLRSHAGGDGVEQAAQAGPKERHRDDDDDGDEGDHKPVLDGSGAAFGVLKSRPALNKMRQHVKLLGVGTRETLPAIPPSSSVFLRLWHWRRPLGQHPAKTDDGRDQNRTGQTARETLAHRHAKAAPASLDRGGCCCDTWHRLAGP
jgi:hypothetical protein